MGSGASTEGAGTIKEVIPPWVYTVKIPPEYTSDKLAACSDGMTQVGPNTVSRSRTGQFDTDGARWSRGFTSGKHTFEIVFPMAHRAFQASVGVSTEDAPLYAKGRSPLVGANKFSWGICLRSRWAFHKNSTVRRYPATQVYLPDKFYMYIDADAGLLQFGSDLDYYGTALSGIPKNQPLYPTVAATIQGATITVVYRGMGDNSNIGPPPPCVVPAAPQMMSPQIRKEPPPPPPPTVVSNTLPSTSEPVSMKKAMEELPPQEQTAEEEKEEKTDKKPEEQPKAEEKPKPEEKPQPEPEVKQPEAEAEAKPEPEAEKAAAAAAAEAPAASGEGENSGEKASEQAEGQSSGGDA